MTLIEALLYAALLSMLMSTLMPYILGIHETDKEIMDDVSIDQGF